MDESWQPLRDAIEGGAGQVIDNLLEKIDRPPDDLTSVPVDLLNELLLAPGHRFHQRVARALQSVGDDSTVPYARAALEQGFDYLGYTCSEDAVIAKWFSWLLADIGTPAALATLREYAVSPNEEIAEAMTYRLARLPEQG